MENEKALVSKQDFTVAQLSENAMAQLNGITLEIPQLKVPTAGGQFFEIDDEPHKELQGVIVAHSPKSVFFAKDYDGSSQPPDCYSNDGVIGHKLVESDNPEDIEYVEVTCADCPNNVFGSGKNGGKACKEKHQLYILLSGQALPVSLYLPVSSMKNLNSYASKLFTKGKLLNDVVTSFTLEKAVNKTGITYAKVVFKVVRDLTPEEKDVCAKCANMVANIG